MAWFNNTKETKDDDSLKYKQLLDSYNELQEHVKKVLDEKNKDISSLSESVTKKDKEFRMKVLDVEFLKKSNEKLKEVNKNISVKLNDFYIQQKSNMEYNQEMHRIIDNYWNISNSCKYDNGYLYYDDTIIKIDNSIKVSFDWINEKYIPQIWDDVDEKYIDINYTTLHNLGLDYKWHLLNALKDIKDNESIFMLDYIYNNLNENTPDIINRIKKDLDFDSIKTIKISSNLVDGTGNYPIVSKTYADSLGFSLEGSVLNGIKISDDIICFKHDGYGITIGFNVICKIVVTEEGIVYPIINIEKNELQKSHLLQKNKVLKINEL